jgi:hypothetical protein
LVLEEGFDWIKLAEIGATSTSDPVLAVKLSVSCVGIGKVLIGLNWENWGPPLLLHQF